MTALAEVFAEIRPDTKSFAGELKRKLAGSKEVVEVGAKLDKGQFDRAMSALKKDLKSVTSTKAKIEADSAGASAMVKALKLDLSRLNTQVKIDGESSALTAKIEAVKAQLASVSDAKAKLTVDSAAASARLKTIKSQINDIDDQDPTVRVHVESDSMAGAGRQVGILTTALAAIGPAAIPIIGATTLAVGSLGASLGAAGGAAGIFGASVGGVVHGMKESQEEIKKLRTSLGTKDVGSEEYVDTLRTLNAEMRQFEQQFGPAADGLENVKRGWQKFMDATRPETTKVMGAAMQTLADLLPRLAPASNAAAKAVGGLVAEFDAWTKGPGMASLLEFFEERGPAMITSFGRSAGNVIRGIGSLFGAFVPSMDGMTKGLEGMTKSFADWAANLKDTEGFKNFIEYLKENGPKTLALIGSTFGALVNIVKAFAPFGSVMLTLVTQIANVISRLNPATIQVLATAFAAWVVATRLATTALLAHAAAMRVATVASALGATAAGRHALAEMARAIALTAGAAASRIAAAATWLFNAALRANPIGIVVTAVAALAAGLIYAYKHSETFREIVDKAWSVIKGAVSGAWRTIKDVLSALGKFLTDTLPKAFDRFVDFWKDMFSSLKDRTSDGWRTIRAAFTVAFTALRTAVSNIVDRVKDFWDDLFDRVKDITRTAWQAVRTLFGNAFDALRTAVSNVVDRIRDFWNNLFDRVKDITRTAWGVVRTLFSNAFDALRTAVTNVAQRIREFWDNLFDRVKEITRTAWDVVKTTFTNAFTNLRTAVTNVSERIREFWGNMFTRIKEIARTAWDAVKTTFSNAFTSIKTAFGNAVDRIGEIWNGLKEKTKKPVQFVVDTVYNNGIRKVVNAIPGVDDLPELKFASGGVMPGYTPGRDVHHFVSPTGGRLNLSGGEAIMRPEWTRAIGGEKEVARQNALARKGRLSPAPGMPNLGHAFGGVLNFFMGGVTPHRGGSMTNDHGPGYFGATFAGDFNRGSGYDDYGDPVVAWKAGEVKTAVTPGDDGSYGNRVEVNHASQWTLYAHLKNVMVRAGQQVAAGARLGSVGNVGNTGNPPTSHLHFEIHGGSTRGVGGVGGGPMGAAQGDGDGFFSSIPNPLRFLDLDAWKERLGGMGEWGSMMADMAGNVVGGFTGWAKDKITSFYGAVTGWLGDKLNIPGTGSSGGGQDAGDPGPGGIVPVMRAAYNYSKSRWSPITIGTVRNDPDSDHHIGVGKALDLMTYTNMAKGQEIANYFSGSAGRSRFNIENVIWNRRITNPGRGWQWGAYTGPSPHTDHVHIDTFDRGGLASRRGYLPKDTVRPERILSPRQTEAFERWMDNQQGSSAVPTVHVENIYTRDDAAAAYALRREQNKALALARFA